LRRDVKSSTLKALNLALALTLAPLSLADAQPAPEPAPAPPPPSSTPSSDPELQALLAEQMAEESAPPKLEFYGFADFIYRQWKFKKSSFWSDSFNVDDRPQFIAGSLNLYLKGNLAPSWTSLAEVRFHFAPANDQVEKTDSVQDPSIPDYSNNQAEDPVEFGRKFDYGYIEVERVYLEFAPYPLFAIRAGRFLTPYGIWNVDHGSPVLIDAFRPYIIGDELFPEAQTGFEVYGSTGVGKLDLGYHLTLSNGRGTIEQVGDLDSNKAFGGRIWGRYTGKAEATLGGSWYYGAFSENRFAVKDPVDRQTGWITWQRYRELGLAADLRVQYKGLVWLSEFITQQLVWDDDARGYPPIGWRREPGSRSSDMMRWGGYSILGWRFDWYGVMPFTHFQYYNAGLRDAFAGSNTLTALALGLNVRVVPAVVLKASVHGIYFKDPEKDSPTEDPLWLINAQAAWAF
jgi:hypothetical protein